MHAFPALTDAARIFPDIRFDWVVDEGFSAVPKWHPRVDRVIETAHRRWRKNLLKTFFNGEWRDFYRKLNASQYDVVVDFQSNLKSASVAWLRHGRVHGFDSRSCREWPAHWVYKKRYFVSKNQHAIQRQRELLAQVLGYDLPDTKAEYGVDLSACRLPDMDLPEKYLVFVHNASWSTKLWPIKRWRELVVFVVSQGYHVVLPSGSDAERQRAEQIAKGFPAATALPRLPLDETAAILSSAKAAVCSDTGLAHLAAVVGTPSVTIYGATDTHLIGTFGERQQHMIASEECSPCYRRKCFHPSATGNDAFCMQKFSADEVWRQLQTLLEP